jgi:excisionase family DNA binding protein
MKSEENLIPVREAKEILNTTRQGVYFLLKTGRLNGFKSPKHDCWLIPKKALKRYLKSKYKRKYATLVDKKRVFKKDSFTVEEASKLGHVPRNHFYYLIKKAKIPYEKVGAQYILKKEDIEAKAKDWWGVRDNDNQL